MKPAQNYQEFSDLPLSPQVDANTQQLFYGQQNVQTPNNYTSNPHTEQMTGVKSVSQNDALQYRYTNPQQPHPSFPSPSEGSDRSGSIESGKNKSLSETSADESGKKGSKRVGGKQKLSETELRQRRKAQNRAAQRAFRERKEGKLRELSEKLSVAETDRQHLKQQLAELKQKNAILDMENRFLQEKGFENGENTRGNDGNAIASGTGSFVFPDFSRDKFIHGSVDMQKHEWKKSQFGSKAYEVDKAALLTIGAVWDYLVEFAKKNEDISINIPGIMEELRGKEVCHGYGPAYPLTLVNKVLQKNICQGGI